VNYSRPLRWIHWSIAILVTLQLAIAVVLTQLRSLAYGQFILALHRQLGLVILLLILARLFLKQGAPTFAPGVLPALQVRAAAAVHRLFFVILVAQPLIGILVAWGRGDTVGLFGLMQIHSPIDLVDAVRSSLDEASSHVTVGDLKRSMTALTMKLAPLAAAQGVPSAEDLQVLDGGLQDLVDSITMNSLQARSEEDENAARGHDLIVITMLPMLMVGLMAALILSRSITSLLSHMRSLIRSIEEDRGESSIRVEGNGEFATLTRDIARMRDAVGSRANAAAARQAELEAERARAAQDLLRKDAERERQQSASRRVHREQLAEDFELQVADIVGTLVKMAKELSTSAARMASSAASSTRCSLDASEGAKRTNGTALEVAAGSGELSTTARSVRENAEESKSRAGVAVQEATAVKRQIERLLAAIEQISTTTDSIAAVARQTNLLAINARIEAARAGDVGRGFSVVADEVKVLANQTREATRGIETHIAQAKAAAAVSAESLQRLDQVIAGVDQATSAIFTATDAQFASTKQLVERMAEISSATGLVVGDTKNAQERAGETELMSNAVLEVVAIIDEQADQLRAKIATFVTELRNGGDSDAATSSPPRSVPVALRAFAS
jgi:methyl-accepting chemotaxis protein/cytochrome b561